MASVVCWLAKDPVQLCVAGVQRGVQLLLQRDVGGAAAAHPAQLPARSQHHRQGTGHMYQHPCGAEWFEAWHPVNMLILLTSQQSTMFPVNLELVNHLWLPNVFIYNLRTFKVWVVWSNLFAQSFLYFVFLLEFDFPVCWFSLIVGIQIWRLSWVRLASLTIFILSELVISQQISRFLLC